MRKLSILALVVLALAMPLSAQVVSPATATQQTASRADACTLLGTATGLGNAAVTVTVTPPPGQYVYLCQLHLSETANAAVTGATGVNTVVSTTGLSVNFNAFGDNSSLTVGQTKDFPWSFAGNTVRTATPGSNFTFAWANTGQSTQNVRLNVWGYFAY